MAGPSRFGYAPSVAQLALDPLSFDELYRRIEGLAEGMTGEILEPGVLRVMSRPAGPHRFAARAVLRALKDFDSGDGGHGWWFEIEAEIRLPGDRLVVPDIAGWRAEGVPAFVRENPIRVVPAWCCELLSPTTAKDDRALKVPLYARSGVEWIWLVDPELRFVEVYESVNGRATLAATARDEETPALPPFGAELALARWWLPEAGPSE